MVTHVKRNQRRAHRLALIRFILDASFLTVYWTHTKIEPQSAALNSRLLCPTLIYSISLATFLEKEDQTVARPANNQADSTQVPDVVITRLPQYIRVLNSLSDVGVEVVSSQQLGEQLQVTPAQIRKDLSYLGRFGKQGRGYSVSYLATELKQILGLNRRWNVCLVGVGRLGKAILSYPGFAPEGFEIVAAFDTDAAIVGQTISGLTIHHIEDLDRTVTSQNISIGIIAVPSMVAHKVMGRLTECGIKTILNYAPVYPQVPRQVKVRNVDPVLALQSMTYYLVH